MARKTAQRKRSHTGEQIKQSATHTPTATTGAGDGRWTSAFDSSDSSLALVRSGLNGHKLRIIDVQTGTLRSEHTAADGARIRSVAWSPHEGAQALVAVGLQTGAVQLYSPARGAVTQTLDAGAHQGSAVVDLAFTDARTLLSLDQSGLVVQWDVEAAAVTLQLRTGLAEARRLLPSKDGKRVALASHRIELWDLALRRLVQEWPGHTAAVHSLVWAAGETALVSAALGDRHVHVWDASPNAAHAASAVLALDRDARYIDVSPNGSVLAVASDGALYTWHQAAAPRRTEARKPESARDLGYAPDGSLRVVLTLASMKRLTLQLARFSRVAGDETARALVVRGSTQQPLFETLALADEHGHFVRGMVVERPADEHVVEARRAAQDVAGVVAYAEGEDAVITSPANDAVHVSQRAVEMAVDAQGAPTLADRVRQMSVDPAGDAPGSAAAAAAAGSTTTPLTARMNAGSLVRVLVQALHTADGAMLDSVLGNSARTNIVRDTVLGLPVAYVLPLVQQLFLRFHTTPARAAQLLPWIRVVLTIHSAYLTSLPSLVPQLAGFYQGIEARLESHQRLLKLSGRLELANAQIRARSRFEKEQSRHDRDAQRQTTMKPINVYHESEDDDSDSDPMAAGSAPLTPAWQADESTDDDSNEDQSDEENQWSDDTDSDPANHGSASDDDNSGDDDDSDSDSDDQDDDDEDNDDSDEEMLDGLN
ncbi:Small subunit (SSU) processome component [Coemansia erecta]|uniref:Small subunit (SSU) processome component n=1 Tax=Coemansia erecta TaxID=147472 RepID=A0A9W7XWL4_9FUNG|nr:Small subunit (SSU) processome component [Coemansia erecta]